MSDKEPTKRALLLRQRALRVMEKGLPEQVRAAYGAAPLGKSASSIRVWAIRPSFQSDSGTFR